MENKDVNVQQIAIIAGVAALIALIALMAIGGFGFWGALLIAILVGIVVAIIVYFALQGKAEAPGAAQVTQTAPSEPAKAATPEPAAEPAKEEPAPAPEPAPAAEKKAETPATGGDGAEPELLSGPDGMPDDLKKIRGIGPGLEQKLNGLGIFHFRQIAALTPANVEWLDEQLSFKGRIERDEWIRQAKEFAAK
ncbi:MAG: NADH:ubiquinone oxidoreductase [Rhodobacteraceae bacterium]|nr:NADH:ubiquinone oxidoreductase [Paracoccaceae bacterium]